MGSIGFKELLLILVIALVVFGTKKLRSIATDLGGAVTDFKKAMNEGEKDAEQKQVKQLPSQDADFSAADKQAAKPEQKSNT
jgi:sec-independent protein translocase protein TatA